LSLPAAAGGYASPRHLDFSQHSAMENISTKPTFAFGWADIGRQGDEWTRRLFVAAATILPLMSLSGWPAFAKCDRNYCSDASSAQCATEKHPYGHMTGGLVMHNEG
jgi:hypothetical protein